MNKTEIINYALLALILKLWNVSIGMRARLKWILKNKRIIFGKFSPNTTKLNGWAQYGKYQAEFEEELEKGMMNYSITSKKEADALISLNNELRCALSLEEKVEQITFDWVMELEIFTYNLEHYSNHFYREIDYLSFDSINSESLANFVKRVSKIKRLSIKNTTLSKLDLSRISIESIYLENVVLTETVILPKHLSKLDIFGDYFTKLLPSSIDKISFSPYDISSNANKFSEEELNWIKSLRNLKEITVTELSNHYIAYLPSSVRIIKANYCLEEPLPDNLGKKLPYLIEFQHSIPVLLAEELKLRKISNIVGECNDILSIRPKQIEINYKNSNVLSKHPEIFEKVEQLFICSPDFSLDCLPNSLKYIRVTVANPESFSLTRLEEE